MAKKDKTGQETQASGPEKKNTAAKATDKKTDAGKTDASAPTKKRRRRKGLGAWYMLKDGRSMSLTFFRRNGWLILLAVVAVIWLISQRYSNQSRMEKIKSLEKELTRAESEKLDAKADYMSLIRETRMRELMQQKRLDLQYQETPPCVITK